MPKAGYYVPTIRRDLVAMLYHERKRRGIPMTRLVNEILERALVPTGAIRVMETPPPPES